MSSSGRGGLITMTAPRTVLTGLSFGESPRWHDGKLVVSDWGAGDVLAVSEDGTSEVLAHADAFPLCVDFLPDGRMLLVAGPTLLRQEPDGSLVPHADLGAFGETPWNDIVVDDRGNAYVNNIGFDFGQGDPKPGWVVVVHPDGQARVVADGLMFPNGMAITPDGRTLVVAESYGSCLTAYDIEDDGGLANRRVWAGLGEDNPDGICLDAEGAAWYADVPHGHCVRVAEGGQVLQTVELGRGGFACVLGGPERRTLYAVTNEWGPEGPVGDHNSTVVALEVDVPGAGHP
ncbi:MAG TPA: SMP-30/gluconolactonase/LRE family protein [Lapillicoccus sp.]|nr:SMP-30/gluconolactonase/LRE family protein [Lapillicoccus sp.]